MNPGLITTVSAERQKWSSSLTSLCVGFDDESIHVENLVLFTAQNTLGTAFLDAWWYVVCVGMLDLRKKRVVVLAVVMTIPFMCFYSAVLRVPLAGTRRCGRVSCSRS